MTKAGAEGARFARLGLFRPTDFALHLPLRYEDRTSVIGFSGLRAGVVAQVRGRVVSVEQGGRARRGGTLTARLQCDKGELQLRFLHAQTWVGTLLQPGRVVLAYGAVRIGLFGLEMVHPTLRANVPDSALATTLTPVYPTVAGIGQSALRAAIARALEECDLSETLPADELAALGLPSFALALHTLHAPRPSDAIASAGAEAVQVSVARGNIAGRPGRAGEEDLAEDFDERVRRSLPWRRIALDELVAQQLALARARALREEVSATPLRDDALAIRLRAALPFQLTRAQERVSAEIARDLASARAMHRLLQGDVGSGKTVVAALAAAQAIGSGRQVALMAPTEILAEQHWHKLAPWLEPLGVRVAWLTGSLRAAQKRAARAAAADGTADLVIGTHALVEDSTLFACLGLAIVDEQHRFGVAQRLALLGPRAQAGGVEDANSLGGDASVTGRRAHLLMMSATPIPRTLAMSYCADLDLSVIDELPPGRLPVVTRIVDAARRDELAERIRAAAATGRQVYWVCPLIEESESLDLRNASETFEWLSQALTPLRVGLVHGRQSAATKAQTMAEFAAGTIDVLVSTTVIEVGVDVPNASLMIIEHAERFGLAQLHQLRGRVGRGSNASACVLLARYPLSALARERLNVIRDSQDGFEIARRDLALRGPGEFLGARQSGVPMLRFADLERDDDLLEVARRLAARLLTMDQAMVDRHLERWAGVRSAMAKA